MWVGHANIMRKATWCEVDIQTVWDVIKPLLCEILWHEVFYKTTISWRNCNTWNWIYLLLKSFMVSEEQYGWEKITQEKLIALYYRFALSHIQTYSEVYPGPCALRIFNYQLTSIWLSKIFIFSLSERPFSGLVARRILLLLFYLMFPSSLDYYLMVLFSFTGCIPTPWLFASTCFSAVPNLDGLEGSTLGVPLNYFFRSSFSHYTD